MLQANTGLLLARDEYDIILTCLRGGRGRTSCSQAEADMLLSELGKAVIIDKTELPHDVVRLNSTVTVRDIPDGKSMMVTIVTPEKSDIRQRKISVLSPIGAALIGLRQGQEVQWEVPAGKKKFRILEVTNDSMDHSLAATGS